LKDTLLDHLSHLRASPSGGAKSQSP
jgi:hypothetical protein